MRIVFAGTPDVAVPALEALLASRHTVIGVLTRPDAPSGRGRTLHPSPVAEVAAQHGLEVLKPAKVRDEEFLARLRELAPDCCPVVAYGALLPQVALDIPPRGWVNLHFSVLPRWRGAAPVQHAVLAGDTGTGATTFRIVKELDAGPVFAMHSERIAPTDTSGDLLGRLAVSGAQLLVDTLDGIEAGRLEPIPQPEHGITIAPKITVDDAAVDWSRTSDEIDRLIRGCAPAPGAWTTFRGERFKINSALPGERRRPGPGCGRGHQAGTPGGHGRRIAGCWGRSARRARSRWPPRTGRGASPGPRTTASADDRPGDPESRGTPRILCDGSEAAQGIRHQGIRDHEIRDPPDGWIATVRAGKPDRARRLAFDALRAVNGDGAYANLALGRLLDERRLPARDAAFATELLAGTCRRQGTYDLIIELAAGRTTGSLQPAVLDLLRLGTHQSGGMRVPVHAAVAATVDLAAATVGQRVRGLVNAVLRKVAARDWDEWVGELTRGAGGERRAGHRVRPPALDRRRLR